MLDLTCEALLQEFQDDGLSLADVEMRTSVPANFSRAVLDGERQALPDHMRTTSFFSNQRKLLLINRGFMK